MSSFFFFFPLRLKLPNLYPWVSPQLLSSTRGEQRSSRSPQAPRSLTSSCRVRTSWIYPQIPRGLLTFQKHESCFYPARSSRRRDRDGLHHRNVWRVSNGENPAVPHARRHLSGRVPTDCTLRLALFGALSECAVLLFHSFPSIRAAGKVKPCTSTQKEPSDRRDSSLSLRGKSAAQHL